MPEHTAAAHSADQILPFKESLLAMLGISFVVMLVAFDTTVVGTALPTIVAELRGFELYAWVATAYLLTSVITVPIFGRLGDVYGRKPFVLISILLFSASSALCGLASNMLLLVLARALQGIGGGMLVGTAFACIPDLFPGAKVRLRWQVILSTAFGIATAVGPSLGGFLTQYFGWRSVFFVNLPIGALSLFFVYHYLPHIRHGDGSRKARLDWLGALLIATTLGALQLFVEWLPKYGVSVSMLCLLFVSAAAAYWLWKWESTTSHPILPFDLIFDDQLAPLFLLSVLSGFSMFSIMFYAPLLYQGGFGLEPKDAGVLVTPMVACIMIGSISSSRIVPHLKKPTILMYPGFILLAICCLGIVFSNRTTSHGVIITTMIAGGLGLGLILPNITIFIQQGSGRQHVGIATALMQSLRMIGSMLGTALTGTLVNRLYAHRIDIELAHHNALEWRATFDDPQILINKDEQRQVLADMAARHIDGPYLIGAAHGALVDAIHYGLLLAVAVSLASIYVVYRVKPMSLQTAPNPLPVIE